MSSEEPDELKVPILSCKLCSYFEARKKKFTIGFCKKQNLYLFNDFAPICVAFTVEDQVKICFKGVMVKPINLTSTGIIHAPATGKSILIRLFQWSSTTDITTALRFGINGELVFPLLIKGVIGMNLLGAYIEGNRDEPLYGYLSGEGTMKGTVLIEEI